MILRLAALAVGIVIVCTVLAVFARPTPKPTFDDHWPALKGTANTKVVRTIPITGQPRLAAVPPPQEPPAEVTPLAPHRDARDPPPPRVERAPPKRQAKAPRRGGDVCERHGLRKVVTRGGRSWRCKR